MHSLEFWFVSMAYMENYPSYFMFSLELIGLHIHVPSISYIFRPVMVATQKITSLAFSLADGNHGNREKLSDLRRKHLLKYDIGKISYTHHLFLAPMLGFRAKLLHCQE